MWWDSIPKTYAFAWCMCYIWDWRISAMEGHYYVFWTLGSLVPRYLFEQVFWTYILYIIYVYIICCSASRQPQNTPYNICCRVTPASGQPRDTLSNQLEELTVRFRRWIQANGIQWHISFEKGVWFFPMRYTLSIQRRHIYIYVCVGSWGYST